MGATNNFIGANFVLGMANLVFPEYAITRWQTTLVAYLFALLSISVNLFAPHLLHHISRTMLFFNVGSFFTIMIVLLATNDQKQDRDFVWQKFENFSGFGFSMASIIGLLQACFGMCCYEAPSHMAEEMNNASREAPKAMILSVVIGAFTGFAFLITLCYCIGDISETANTPTLVPVIQIIYHSTGNTVATCILSSMITIVVMQAGLGLTAEGSRMVFAFSRDHGLPFANLLGKVQKGWGVPVWALLLAIAVQVGLNSIDFGTTTGFETVIAISTEGFCK